MFKNIFKTKKKAVVYAPIEGVYQSLSSCSDPGFAAKALGDGFLIIPEKGFVYAPFKGVVSAVFPTKHAIGLTSDEGLELLIHMGIDSFELNGKGIDVRVQTGDSVSVGDVLAVVDWEVFKDNKIKHETPIVVTNTSEWQLDIKTINGSLAKDTIVIEYEAKD